MGSSIAAAGGIIAAMNATTAVALVMGTAGVAGDVIGVVSGAVETSNPQASATLGWVSLGVGIVSMVGVLKFPNSIRNVKRGIKRARGDLFPVNTLKKIDLGPEIVLEKEVFWVPELDISQFYKMPDEEPFKPSKGSAMLQVHGVIDDAGNMLGIGFIEKHGELILNKPEQVAKYFNKLNRSDRYSREGTLLLVVCHAGRKTYSGGTSMAQRFANASGIDVIASTGATTGYRGEKIMLAVDSDEPFRTYRPNMIRRAWWALF